MPKQDNEKVKRERKIKSTINLEKLTKIQKHDIFKGHTNKNQEIDKKKNVPSVHESSGFMPGFAFTTRT
jgi:uncharacterized membrane protein YjjP (DUF1212 family)